MKLTGEKSRNKGMIPKEYPCLGEEINPRSICRSDTVSRAPVYAIPDFSLTIFEFSSY